MSPTPAAPPSAPPTGPDPDTGTATARSVPSALVLAPALAVTGLLLDLALGADVGLLFGLCFVTACVGLGLLADVRRFYLAALVPPLTMLVCLVVVGLVAPGTLGAPGAGAVAGVVAGFAHHSWALGLGYLLCLAGLGARLRLTR